MSSEIWHPDFYNGSAIFSPIENFSALFSKNNSWPSLTQINQLFATNNLNIKAVPQMSKPEKFDDLYESRIFLKGELQTRTENWHDFFNAMAWLRFPQIKHTLNSLHYKTSLSRKAGSNRSPLENAIALFDECGLIIVSDRQDLLDLIRNHQWKMLFFEHRKDFDTHINCITFGHAMYEKALNPYIGMTAHSILIHSSELLNKNIMCIDKTIADMFKNNNIATTRDLQPVPILGIPGWYHNEQSESFYENTDYFRPKKC